MEYKMETCGFCKETNEEVIDGICPKCEPLWLDNIGKAAKKLGPGGSVKDMFKLATDETKIQFDKPAASK